MEVIPAKIESSNSAKTRVWVVCRRLGAPSEVWLYRQIQALTRFTPEVVCWGREGQQFYPLDGVPVHVLPFAATPEMGRGRWFYRFRNGLSRNFYATVGRERETLERLARESKPNVILCHYGHTALRLLPVAQRYGIPLVAHFHGIDVSGSLGNPWYRWSLRNYLKQFAALVVVADYQREHLLKLGADPHRIHTIPCGVPVEEIEPARLVGRQPCHFLAVGRLIAKKGPLETLRAFGRCAEQVPDVCLTIVGDGPLVDDVRRLRAELGLTDRVNLPGKQSADVVLKELHRAGVFVQHSVRAPGGDMEGWPVSIAEAMAAGLPIVSTRHAGIEQQVRHGENGYLVAEHDWQTMGDHMAELARGPELRTRFGRRSREIAVESFGQRHLVDRLEALLAACVQQARPRRRPDPTDFSMTSNPSHYPRQPGRPIATVEIVGPWLLNKGDGLMLGAISRRLADRCALAGAEALGTTKWPREKRLLRTLRPVERSAIRKARNPAQAVKTALRAAALRMAPDAVVRRCGAVDARNVDLLLDSSGFAYGDPWSTRRTNARVAYYSYLKRHGTKLVLLPQALGPFEKPDVRAASRSLLELFDLIYVRDVVSLQHVRKLDLPSADIRLCPDITHTVEAAPVADPETWRRRIGLVPNMRMLDKTDGSVGRSYLDTLVRCAQRAHAAGFEPCVILHEANDRPMVEQLQAAVSFPLPVFDDDPFVTKGYIGACHALVSSRYHSIISALGQGTPVLSMSWSHKYGALFEEYGCGDWIASPAAGLAELDRQLDRLLDQRERDRMSAQLERIASQQKGQVEQMWLEIEQMLPQASPVLRNAGAGGLKGTPRPASVAQP